MASLEIRREACQPLVLSFNSYAGFNGFTMHSRANCVNNESISWDWTHDWWLLTRSYHYAGDTNHLKHIVQTPGAWTWRSAAVHWEEGGSGWVVYGEHFRHYTEGTYHLEKVELVYDCSIYDGWWDKNK